MPQPHRHRTCFWLIRHAPLDNAAGRFPRPEGEPNLSGRAALTALAGHLPPGALWVASLWPRARRTAAALSALCREAAAEPRLENRLAEQDFGRWAGLTYDQAERQDPEAYRRLWDNPLQAVPPGGESFADQVARVKAALTDLIRPGPEQDGPEQAGGQNAEQGAKQNSQQDADIIIVAHAGTIRAALAAALGGGPEAALRFAVDPLSLTRMDHFAGPPAAWRIGAVNQQPPAPGPAATPFHAPAAAPRATLVLGGIRSGKSAYAESLALAAAGPDQKPLYIATADPALSAADPEMRARLERHHRRRGDDWRLIEAPHDLPARLAALAETKEPGPPVLVDSLGVWLGNRLEAAADIEAETNRLTGALTATAAPVILVADEVGSGGVAAHPAARAFADHAGRLNARLAALCGRVVLVTAGLPHVLKETPAA